MLNVHGSIIWRDTEFDNNGIKELMYYDVTGWKFGGAQLPGESNICIANDDNTICEVFDTLEDALCFLRRLDEIPDSAQAGYVNNMKQAGWTVG